MAAPLLPPNRSASRRAAVVFVFIALMLVLMGYWYYRAEMTKMLQEKSQELAAIAELKASQIQLWRKERWSEGRKAAKDLSTVKAIANFLQAPDDKSLRKELAERLGDEVTPENYANILLFDANANLLLATEDASGQVDLSTQQAIRSAIATKEAVFSNFFQRPDGFIYIDLTVPVRDGAGQALAVLVLRINANTYLLPLVQSWPTQNKSGETVLVARDGSDVVFLNSRPALMVRRPLTQTNLPAVQAALGRQGGFMGKDYRGVDVLSDLRPIPESPWFMEAKMDAGEILSEARFRTAIISLITVLFILLVAAVVAYLYRSRQAVILQDLLEAEEGERESHGLLDAVINSVPMRVFWKDRSSVFLGCNGPFARDAGFANPAEIAGMDDRAMPWREQAEKYRADDRDVIESGESKILFEETRVMALGKSIPLLASKLPLRDANGETIGVIGVYLDITERKLAEKELRNFRTAVEQSANTIVITDPTGNIEYVNPAFEKSSGYTAAEAVGNNPRIMKSGSQCASFYQTMWVTLSSGKIWKGEFHNRRKNGSLYWEAATISPIFDEQGTAVHFIAIKEDITERKLLEANLHEALARAESAARAKSEFLAMMSHELRTPLNGVLGFADLLAETDLDHQQQDYAKTITSSGQHLLAVVNDILDFSSIENGRLKLDFAPVVISDLVESACLPIRKYIIDKGLDYRCETDPGVPKQIHGDAHRLRQILINLLGNAVKFTSSGSIVLRIAPAPAGGLKALDFSVVDSGPGIPPDALGLLFKPFSQVDSTLHRQFDGTGLGLAISQRIARAMGGMITVTSTLGKGSTFSFRLPIEADFLPPVRTEGGSQPLTQDPPAGGMPVPLPGDRLQQPAGGGLVLVVEDDRTSSLLTGKILEALGYRTDFAWNGLEAFDAFVPGKYVAILMDMQMPVMDGIEATKKIREKESGLRIPIIALTANVMPGDLERCLAIGMDDFLSKPVKKADLAAKLARFFG